MGKDDMNKVEETVDKVVEQTPSPKGTIGPDKSERPKWPKRPPLTDEDRAAIAVLDALRAAKGEKLPENLPLCPALNALPETGNDRAGNLAREVIYPENYNAWDD